MKRLPIATMTLVLCLGWLGTAHADLTPGTIYAVDYLGVGSTASTERIHTSTRPDVTVYTGPYWLAVDGGPASLWFCFNSAIFIVDDPWKAMAANTTGAAAYYGGNEKQAQMIAYLASLFTPTSTLQQRENLQLAMWEVTADFNGGLGSLQVDSGMGSFYLYRTNSDQVVVDVEKLLADAYNATSSNEANFLLPLTGYTTQPFVQPVPEPATLLLLGSGLVGIGWFGWRKRGNATR